MSEPSAVHWVKADPHYVQQMMSWFPDAESLAQWGGPNMRIPFDLNSFLDDLNLSNLHSYCLLDEKNQLTGFGQYYERIGRCHLGRLAINPDRRNRGLSNQLLSVLCELGTNALQVSECSLFVLENNPAAIKAYQRFGFSRAEYPTKIPMANCSYMIARL